MPGNTPNRPSRWVVLASLTIGVLALGVAIGCWFRPPADNKGPASSPATKYTDQQVVEAKAKVCAAHQKVHHAVGLTSGRSSDDPSGHLAIATSARQALDAGGRYLLSKLAEEPATPADLTEAVRKLANSFQELTVDYLAEVSDAELDPLLRTSDQATLTIESLCK